MEIEAILFDAGGVITSANLNAVMLRLIAEKEGVPYDELRRSWHMRWHALEKDELSIGEFWSAIAAENDLATGTDEMLALFRSTVDSNAEIIRLIEQLKENYTLVLTNNEARALQEIKNDIVGFEKFFDVRCSSWILKSRKPEKEYYDKVLEKTNVPAERCLFIDDKERNTDAAKTLGINTILFSSAEQLRTDFRAFGIFTPQDSSQA